MKSKILPGILALAVAWWAGLAAAADVIITRSGTTQTGEVVRVEAGSVVFKISIGEISLPKSDIARVVVTKPAGVDPALAAFKAKKYADAVAGLKPVVDRYGGLDLPWAQEAMLKLGDADVGLKQFAEAKKVYDAYGRLYPQLAGDSLTPKYALVLVEQKQYTPAAEMLQKFLEPRLSKVYVTEDQDAAIAQALILRGDCQRATESLFPALDDYLLVVTVYNSDDELAATARFKAAEVFEMQKNWKRAQGLYEEVVKDGGNAPLAAAAQKRLDAIKKDHPG